MMDWAYSPQNGVLSMVVRDVERLAETYPHMIYFEAELVTE